MTADNKIKLIRSRLEKRFMPRYLQVIDESDHHVGHAGHQGGGRHFAIQIASDELDNLKSLDSHRLVYELFTDLMPEEIHALKIKVIRS